MSYGQPPPGQYGYPPQNQGYGQQGGYPPPQGGFPPQQGYGYPQGPPQHFGGPPPPQQGGWGAPQGPPPGHVPPPGPPPGQHQGYGAPPPGQYPPQQQHNQYGGPAAPPSPGYVAGQQAQGDASRDADALRSAMKGFGTDENTLIRVLSKPDPLQMALLKNTFNQKHRRDLEKDIKSETSGKFETMLVSLTRGPLMSDVHNVHDAIKGLGTKESVLTDVLVGRSNADMRAIKQAYQQAFRNTLEADVKNDLSMKTQTHFEMIMSATRNEESSPVIPQELEQDCHQLHQAMGARVGTDQTTVCSILSKRSDGQIRAIAHHWQQKYHTSLEDAISKEFSGHMRDTLMLQVQRASDRAMCDAMQLEDSMAGVGTKDTLLTQRAVRVHWNRQHMDQVKRAYNHRYKRDLLQRIRGEIHTSRHWENLLVECLS